MRHDIHQPVDADDLDGQMSMSPSQLGHDPRHGQS
jgi:hypothetical protein